MVTVRPARIEDAITVADIYKQGILTRAAAFDAQPRSSSDRRGIFQHDPARVPILVAEGELGAILGWTALSQHYLREGTSGIGECSVYVEEGHRGQGVGTQLIAALIREARALGYWKLLAKLLVTDEASRALCLNEGFREVGVLERHTRQDGRWVDVILVERLIPENQP